MNHKIINTEDFLIPYGICSDTTIGEQDKPLTELLKEYADKQLAANEDIGEAFEEAFGCRSDYFNHRVGLFNDMKDWIVKKYNSKT